MNAYHQTYDPVRPHINSCVELSPNEVYSGGVAPEGTGPEEVDENFEEWAPPASPPIAQISRQQRERHALSGHVLYQSWYPHCVRMRGLAFAHSRSNAQDSQAFPVLHWDYAYLSSRTPDDDQAAELRRESPLLCMRDAKGEGLYVYLAPQEGH